MSVKSQENNMRRLSDLLSQDLGYIWGEKECGPNGAKKTFLNVGKVFLRALSKDLGLRDAVVKSNPGGIAVSGECYLIGMWENGGIYIELSQFFGGREAILYHTVRHMKDYTGGHNHYISLRQLRELSYSELLDILAGLRKDRVSYERAA